MPIGQDVYGHELWESEQAASDLFPWSSIGTMSKQRISSSSSSTCPVLRAVPMPSTTLPAGLLFHGWERRDQKGARKIYTY